MAKLEEGMHDASGVEDGRARWEHQDVGHLEAMPRAVSGKKMDAGDAHSGNLDGAVSGVDAKSGRTVGDAAKVRDVGDGPKGGHGVNKGGDKAATGRRAKSGRDGWGRHGGNHTTIS